MAGRVIRVELPQPFEPGMVKLAFAEGAQILIINAEGKLHAIANSCPHAGASLYGGKVIGQRLRCPSHGMLIDLASGCVGGDGGMATPVYPLELTEGGVLLSLP